MVAVKVIRNFEQGPDGASKLTKARRDFDVTILMSDSRILLGMCGRSDDLGPARPPKHPAVLRHHRRIFAQDQLGLPMDV